MEDTSKPPKQSTGHIIINRNVYNHWTPHRLKTFHAFIGRGHLKSEQHIDPNHIDFYLRHPDFIEQHEGGEYIIKWSHKAYDGYNHEETIAALFTKQPDGVVRQIRVYHD